MFETEKAFSRNLGWISEDEQKVLGKLHVGIVGLGGVGGQYAEILARLGVGRFTICDHDTFAVENTNRQNSCQVSNYGKNKAEVIRDLIQDINPKAHVVMLNQPMSLDSVDGFCRSIDIYLDGLDFFEVDVRIAVFRKMHELKKPAITVAPIGTGAANVTFTGDSMSFDDYFGLHTTTDVVRRSLMFLTGLAPSLQHLRYIQDRTRANFAERKVPSLGIGVYSAAAFAATTLLKIVLGRGPIVVAPWAIHYDPYLMRQKKKYVVGGYRNPLQKLKLAIALFMFKKQAAGTKPH